LDRLRSRVQYQAVARGAKAARPGLVLQAAAAIDLESPPRLGFTVSRKVGNAVARNRVRRRLKEAVRVIGGGSFKPGMDYVVIGRRAAIDRAFSDLVGDLVAGLAAVERANSAAGDRHGR
jgi:ribonuclease P protein component